MRPSFPLSGYLVLTIDSFIPILLRSSISLLSDMWFPIPILLFICVSACCSQCKVIRQDTKLDGKNKMVYVYHKTNLYLICHIRCKIYLLVYSRLSCIHCGHGEKPYCFLHILLSSKMRSGARINHQGTFCQKKDAWTNKRIKQKSALKKGKTEER